MTGLTRNMEHAMSQAGYSSTTTHLSSLIRDPFVRAAFERAERDL
jgi:hypothetical protein